MKKKTFILGGLALILMATVGVEYYYFFYKEETPDYQKVWLTTREIPKEIEMRSYLSGNMARQTEQLETAISDYLKVLKKDPHNQPLIKTTYLMAMSQGCPERIIPYLNTLILDSETLMLDYLKVAHFLKQNQGNSAQMLLKGKAPQKIDALLAPLISSWIYAQNNDKEKALNELKKLNDNKTFSFIKGYHTFLLGQYLKDSELTKQGLMEIQGKRLPAVGFFPLLKTQAEQQIAWEKSDLFLQYQKMNQNYPATAELVLQKGEKALTFESGLAEIFYLVSADTAGGILTKEEALFLNSIALYLDPDKQLALIWGSELTNNLKMPQVSLNYYKKITPKSATLLFKEATLLTAQQKNDQALQLLKPLIPENKTNASLYILLGQIYMNLNQPQKAIESYSHVLDHLSDKVDSKILARVHLIRANLYYQQNQKEQMFLDLEKAHILLPKDALIQNDLGYNKLLNNQIEEGFQLINEAFQQRPQDPYILDSLAFAYFKKKLPQTALPFAEQALSLMPQSALIHAHLGDIYLDLGRKREAGFQYKKALDLKTDLPTDLIQKINQKISKL